MNNLWGNFFRLLPQNPLLVVVVDAHNADDTSTVSFPGGAGSIRVRGTSVAVGDYAFIQFGQIQGPAPAATPEVIDV